MSTLSDIDRLQLAPYAKECAIKVCQTFPWATFTSGRRSPEDQAMAMANNVIKARKVGQLNWVRATYKHANTIAQWIDQHPNSSYTEVHNFIYDSLLAMDSNDLYSISRHLTGDAFDILPDVDKTGLVTNRGSQLIDFVRRNLPDAKVLTSEGGLMVWHIQVPQSVEV